MSNKSNTGPLTGLKVLDLSRILAGPWATQVLADYGAEIWKIENPKEGDNTRQWGKELTPVDTESINSTDQQYGEQQKQDHTTAYFLSANRGKRSLTIDISKLPGQTIIRKLVQQADILVENFKVGGLKKYSLDYASLKQINPKLVYCSITGFGQTGPQAHQAGYDAIIQASAGLMSVTGEHQGSPQKVGVAISDIMTGMYAVSAILAAIYHRDKSGEGQQIDISLFDSQVSWLANQGMNYLISGKIPEPSGSVHPDIAPYQPVYCKDQSIMLAVGNDDQFKRCCRLLETPTLADNPMFLSNNLRVKNRLQLIQMMEKRLKTKTAAQWIELFSRNNIPCGMINNLQQVFEHPQINARQTVFTLTHTKLGEIPQIANPVKFSNSPISYSDAAPTLGRDTRQTLTEALSYSAQEINELSRLGII
jgi:glutaryl-CoA transferase